MRTRRSIIVPGDRWHGDLAVPAQTRVPDVPGLASDEDDDSGRDSTDGPIELSTGRTRCRGDSTDATLGLY
jgi:hypothetical protein